MTGDELLIATQKITHTSLDWDFFLQKLNAKKNERERRGKFYILTKSDTTQIASLGDTYLSMKTLPPDYRGMRRVNVGDTRNVYTPIPFEEREGYKDTPNRYYIDLANSQFALTGSVGSSKTIRLYYLKKTTDFSEANKNTEILLWPSEFHLLLAFDVALMEMGAIDNDDINRVLTPEQRFQIKQMEEGLNDWDHDLKLEAMGNRRGYAEDAFEGNREYPLELM